MTQLAPGICQRLYLDTKEQKQEEQHPSLRLWTKDPEIARHSSVKGSQPETPEPTAHAWQKWPCSGCVHCMEPTSWELVCSILHGEVDPIN